MVVSGITSFQLIEFYRNMNELENSYNLQRKIDNKKTIISSLNSLEKTIKEIQEIYSINDKNIAKTIKKEISVNYKEKTFLGLFPFIFKEDIIHTSQRLLSKTTDPIVDYNRLKLKTFMAFDYIYNDNYGMFNRFKLDKKLFENTRSIFLKKESDKLKIKNNFIKKTLNYYDKNISNLNEYITLAFENKIIFPFEPLTSYLIFEIDNFDKNETYIKKYIDATNKYYNKEINNLEFWEMIYR
jgi:hypothetical protein